MLSLFIEEEPRGNPGCRDDRQFLGYFLQDVDDADDDNAVAVAVAVVPTTLEERKRYYRYQQY